MGLCFTMKNVPSLCYQVISIGCILILILQSLRNIKHSNLRLRKANSEIVADNLSYFINFLTPYKLCFVSYFHKHLMWHLGIIQCISGILIVLFNIHLFIKTFFSVPILLKLSRIGCGWWNECGGILITSFWKQKLKVHQFPKYSELRVWNCNEFVIKWCTS